MKNKFIYYIFIIFIFTLSFFYIKNTNSYCKDRLIIKSYLLSFKIEDAGGKYKIKRKGALIDFAKDDLNSDGIDELGLVYKNRFSKKRYVEVVSLEKNPKTIYKDDLSIISPWKIVFGDINGDNIKDMGLGIIKKTPHHNVLTKRCFFYDIDFYKSRLIPIYRVSRFIRPLVDYYIFDINKDSLAEVMVLEDNGNKSFRLACYRWKGFGFNLIAKSDDFKIKEDFNINDSKLFMRDKLIDIKDDKIILGGKK